MAAHSENNESEQQEWDMEFKDPFSLEGEELTLSCSQPAVATTSFSESHSAVETLNDGLIQRVNTVVTSSLQAFTHDRKTGTTDVEITNRNKNPRRHQSEITANTCLDITMSVDGSKRKQQVNESVASCGKKSAHDTSVELNSSEVTLASSEEQSPIPVVLSSAKRFCASEDIENSQAAKQCSSYYNKLPSPSAVLMNSPVRFAQPTYPPAAYNIPAWPTVCLPLPLPLNNNVTAWRVPPRVPYNNTISYSAVRPDSTNIPVLYNQSLTPVVDDTGAALWPGARLHLQNIVTKPPPPLPNVSKAALLGPPPSDLTVPHLHNGLTSHVVRQIIPPFPPPNINRLPFSTSAHSVLPPQQCQPHIAVPRLGKSGLPLPVVRNISVSAGQYLPHSDSTVQPKPLSVNGDVSVVMSSSALLKQNNAENSDNKYIMPNDKKLLTTEQLTHTLPDTSKSSSTVTSTGVSNFCPSLTSSKSASNETVIPATSSIPPPPMKFSSAFAQLDPRIHNGYRQNSGTSAQSCSSANVASTQGSAFVVPVPPPLPSLEELTADSTGSEDSQKDEAPIVSLTCPSTASNTVTTDSVQLDRVITTAKC